MKLTPQTANTQDKVEQLKRDSIQTERSWMVVYSTKVYIFNQKNGEKSTGQVVLTKKEFEKFINFYLKG